MNGSSSCHYNRRKPAIFITAMQSVCVLFMKVTPHLFGIAKSKTMPKNEMKPAPGYVAMNTEVGTVGKEGREGDAEVLNSQDFLARQNNVVLKEIGFVEIFGRADRI